MSDILITALPLSAIIACIALVIELTIKPLRLIWYSPFHPVMILGFIVTLGKKIWAPSFMQHRKKLLYISGFLHFIMAIILAGMLAFIIDTILAYSLYSYIIGHVIVLSWFLAGADLHFVVNKIVTHNDIAQKREWLAHIVSRDSDNMGEPAIYRSALESLSENFSDGFLAPLFYYVLFGLYGLILYKMINTLDSMIGYKHHYYKYFGFVSAKIDDIANYIPARLSAAMMVLLAIILRKNTWRNMRRVIKRDSAHHPSPNAGVVEAAFAAALQCQLGGPRQYKDDISGAYSTVTHWVGKEYEAANTHKMHTALQFFNYLIITSLCICAVITLIYYNSISF